MPVMASTFSNLGPSANRPTGPASAIQLDVFPVEVLELILGGLDDLVDLDVLIRTSPYAFRVFLRRPTYFLSCVLDNSDTHYQTRIAIDIVSLLHAGKLDLPLPPTRSFPMVHQWFMTGQLGINCGIASLSYTKHDEFPPISEHDLTADQAISLLATARRLAQATQDCIKHYLQKFSTMRHNGLEVPDAPNWQRLLDPDDNDPEISDKKRQFTRMRQIALQREQEKLYLSPPDYVEETRVSKALWRMQSYFELKRALSMGTVKWPEEKASLYFKHVRNVLSFMSLNAYHDIEYEASYPDRRYWDSDFEFDEFSDEFSDGHDNEVEDAMVEDAEKEVDHESRDELGGGADAESPGLLNEEEEKDILVRLNDRWPYETFVGPDGLEARACLEYLSIRYPEAQDDAEAWRMLMNETGDFHRYWPHAKPEASSKTYNEFHEGPVSDSIEKKYEEEFMCHTNWNMPINVLRELAFGSASHHIFAGRLYGYFPHEKEHSWYSAHEDMGPDIRNWRVLSQTGLTLWSNKRATQAGYQGVDGSDWVWHDIYLSWQALWYWLEKNGTLAYLTKKFSDR